jgi:hypothetical protein
MRNLAYLIISTLSTFLQVLVLYVFILLFNNFKSILLFLNTVDDKTNASGLIDCALIGSIY